MENHNPRWLTKYFRNNIKEKDGAEDGGESRNPKCGHDDWQRERMSKEMLEKETVAMRT